VELLRGRSRGLQLDLQPGETKHQPQLETIFSG